MTLVIGDLHELQKHDFAFSAKRYICSTKNLVEQDAMEGTIQKSDHKTMNEAQHIYT